MKNWTNEQFNLNFPIIMAPMFLVSNTEMIIAACNAGITGCLPAHNYRKIEDFKIALQKIKEHTQNPFGVNLIVNKSNPMLKKQLEICLKENIRFIITSLGSPQLVISKAKSTQTKILCDVTNVEYAKKVEQLGADALIAVSSSAGGHAGKIPASILIPMLKDSSSLPIIAAGGVGTGAGVLSMLALGAQGCSIGSPFIATKECSVHEQYKKAVINYGADDIALTDKISGNPCTVIKTPYVKKIGLKQNSIEKFLNNNAKLKKYAKMLTYYKGMKALENAAFKATYKNVFCAGPSIEFSKKIENVADIVKRLQDEYNEAKNELQQKI